MEELDLGQTIRGLAKGQQLFHRYVLTRIAGRGGMGVVWVAQDEKLDREVALKFLPELVIHDAGLLDQMKRETRRSLELTHRNIVRIYDFVGDTECACISMEYVDGPTLSALRVQRPNRIFEIADIGGWMAQACEALQYAHYQARIVHRDLKPANLMLNSKGELKVADFGIARSLTDSVSLLTRSQGTSGTLAYMSPQQLNGDRASHLDDIYSLGALIYDLLTGRPPFYSGQIDWQIREQSPESMTKRRSTLEVADTRDIPPEWEDIVASCLSKHPAQRPQSAAEFAARLDLQISGYIPTLASRRTAPSTLVAPGPQLSTARLAPVSEPPPPDLPNGKGRRTLVVTALVLAMLVGAVTIFISNRREHAPTSHLILTTPQPGATLTPALPIASSPETSATWQAQSLPSVAATPPLESILTAGTPMGAVKLYFEAINRRDLTTAYELTSEEFQQRTDLEQYRKIFATTIRVTLSEISSRTKSGDSAVVTVRFREANESGQESDWSGDIDVTWGHGKWRIDRMKDLVASKPSATAAPKSSAPETASDQRLTKFIHKRYAFSALVPATVFPSPPEQSDDEHVAFTSLDGRSRLQFIVENVTATHKLANAFREWSLERTPEHPNRAVPYKILKSTWFVVSGDEQGRGFYLKCVAPERHLIFMLLEYDEENCAISKESLTAMSRSFDGSLAR
jgi:serine/threonine protein kinase